MAVIFTSPYYHEAITSKLRVVQDGDNLIIPAPKPAVLSVDLTPDTTTLTIHRNASLGNIYEVVSSQNISIPEPTTRSFTYQEFLAGNFTTIDQFFASLNVTHPAPGCEKLCISQCYSVVDAAALRADPSLRPAAVQSVQQCARDTCNCVQAFDVAVTERLLESHISHKHYVAETCRSCVDFCHDIPFEATVGQNATEAAAEAKSRRLFCK